MNTNNHISAHSVAGKMFSHSALSGCSKQVLSQHDSSCLWEERGKLTPPWARRSMFKEQDRDWARRVIDDVRFYVSLEMSSELRSHRLSGLVCRPHQCTTTNNRKSISLIVTIELIEKLHCCQIRRYGGTIMALMHACMYAIIQMLFECRNKRIY